MGREVEDTEVAYEPIRDDLALADRPGPIPEQVQRVTDGLDAIDAELTTLATRLAALLMPDTTEATPSEPPNHAGSQMAQTLGIQADRAYRLADAVRQLAGRVEL